MTVINYNYSYLKQKHLSGSIWKIRSKPSSKSFYLI